MDILAQEVDILAYIRREKGCGTGFAPVRVKRNYAKYANNVHYANYVKRYV